MQTFELAHSCAETMWRVDPPEEFGSVQPCSCGRIFEHRPLSLWRLTTMQWGRDVPAQFGDVWVDVTRRETILRERAERR